MENVSEVDLRLDVVIRLEVKSEGDEGSEEEICGRLGALEEVAMVKRVVRDVVRDVGRDVDVVEGVVEEVVKNVAKDVDEDVDEDIDEELVENNDIEAEIEKAVGEDACIGGSLSVAKD